MYHRKGDINGYLGYQYKHWLRYDFTYGKRLRFGIVASQDAGEPMFAGKNAAGYDYYSLYLQLRSEGAFVESLTVGRYRPAFGMGLVTGPSFSLGKSAMLSTLGRTAAEAVRVHSSRSESDYFQGAAVTLRLHRQVKATAIASYRPLDATLNKDGTAATIVTSGYHRTQAEMAKRTTPMPHRQVSTSATKTHPTDSTPASQPYTHASTGGSAPIRQRSTDATTPQATTSQTSAPTTATGLTCYPSAERRQ